MENLSIDQFVQQAATPTYNRKREIAANCTAAISGVTALASSIYFACQMHAASSAGAVFVYLLLGALIPLLILIIGMLIASLIDAGFAERFDELIQQKEKN